MQAKKKSVKPAQEPTPGIAPQAGPSTIPAEGKEDLGLGAPAGSQLERREDDGAQSPQASVSNKKWYVVHTYSGHENKVKTAIEKGLEGTELKDLVGQILVPVRKTFIIREGKKIDRERKLFTSYVIIEAELNPALRAYILNIAGVTKFLGMAKDHKDPTPLPEDEVNRLLGIADRDPEAKAFSFMPGDAVRVTAGPFSEFEGVVTKAADDGTKLVIDVTVFGRRTPVELNSNQVEVIKK
ncbi:MAG: transcription termination/antitermination factor NusG [Candidatus Cloacimonetes bacterium]|nr:transcription termination/antitermination factor NusG [Candidatus Cloacimonadota bacterium]